MVKLSSIGTGLRNNGRLGKEEEESGLDIKLHEQHKLHDDNGGYSLIELVVVLAITAIIMSTVFYSIILVFSANAKSCVNNIERSIGDCKVTTMGRADAYMVLFRDNEGNVYTQMHITKSDGTVTDEEPQKVGTSKVDVGYTPKNGTETALLPGDSIEIRFDRSNGGFKADAGGRLYEEIYVRGGSKDFRITMTELTGKSRVVAQ